MAQWASTTEASTFDAKQYANNAMGSRSATRSSSNVNLYIGDEKTLYYNNYYGYAVVPKIQDAQQLSGYDVVGISATKVPDMREAIREAVRTIQTHINGVEEYTNSSGAFKSEEIKVAVENYVLSVKEYCKALISDLNAFSDKLETVSQAWLTSASKFASESIEGSKGSLSDNAVYYTEQF